MKILGREFKVQTVKSFAGFKPELNGLVHYENLTISIDEDLPSERKSEILLHEIMHGIGDFFECDLNESQVSRMSNGLYAFLKENNIDTSFLKVE